MDHSATSLLITLVAVILATKLLGELAQRLGQPTVLGELLAGILLGGSVLGVLDPASPVIRALSEIGVLVLLFEIGLHTDVRSLARVGGASLTVASVGVAVPFALGYVVATLLGISTLPAIVCGAALTATSVGISARVLSDLGQLERPEGQIVLGAAVIDDVIGLIILSVVAQIVAGGGIDTILIARTTIVAVGFIAIALIGGSFVAPWLFRIIERIRVSGALGLIALAFAFLLAWLAAAAGSATIIGAFAAGLVLHRTPQRAEIERATTSLGHFFVPIFFAAVGASVDVRTFGQRGMLAVGAALTLVAIVGKLVSGYAPWWFRGRKMLIGVAMVPRGEVGLIFAQMGLVSGALTPVLFSALTLMVMVTTLVTPPLLARLVSAHDRAASTDRPGDGGIDDLVSGTRTDERSVTS
jgi:Kef-type K+ transport system membrane component KefB